MKEKGRKIDGLGLVLLLVVSFVELTKLVTGRFYGSAVGTR